MIETGFGKEFSEPPSVSVSDTRTHCEACQEPLDPNVMHKCHGNQEYQARDFSSTEIMEACPGCKGSNAFVLTCLWSDNKNTYVVVCRDCRTHAGGEVWLRSQAIYDWNRIVASVSERVWPRWMAGLPGDDERANMIQSEAKPSHPDLANYQGACPAVHVEGHECPICEGTGTIPPTKSEGAE